MVARERLDRGPLDDQDGDRLTVSSTGRDADLGFASGQLVELIDDTLELGGRPGTLVELSAPPHAGQLTIASTPPVDISDFPRNREGPAVG